MKNLILWMLLLCSIVSSASAQKVTLTDIALKNFKGVKELKGKGYYACYVDESSSMNGSNFILKFYDYNLTETASTKINLPSNVEIFDGSYNGSNFLIGFISLSGKNAKSADITYVMFDESAKKINQRDVEIKSNFILQVKYLYPKIFPSEDGFFIVQAEKKDKNGFSVEKVDNQLNKQWIESFFPEKGYILPHELHSENGFLAIISTTTPTSVSNISRVRATVFDTSKGEKLYTRDLVKDNSPLPSTILFDEIGNMTLGGMYYKGTKVRGDDSDGIFLSKYDIKGNAVFEKFYPWAGELKKEINHGKKKADYLILWKKMFLFHEIKQQPDGGYVMIGEAFKNPLQNFMVQSPDSQREGTKNSKFLYLLDFGLFYFDKNGDMGKLDFILKESKSIDLEWFSQNIERISASQMRVARQVKRNGLFTYRYISEVSAGKKIVVFKNRSRKGDHYIGIADLDDPDNFKKIPLDIKETVIQNTEETYGVIENEVNPDKITIWSHNKREKTIDIWLQEY